MTQQQEPKRKISKAATVGIHTAMAKFKTDDYAFLESVEAVRRDETGKIEVLRYPMSLIEQYENTYFAPHRQALADEFIFAEVAEERRKVYKGGKSYEWEPTGRFIPRLFWDWVASQ